MPAPKPNWFERLTDEDRSFIKRFLLASGSLKQLAEEYRISYPTIRLRLDRLIAKIHIFDDQQIVSPFEQQVRALLAEGRIDQATCKQLIESYRDEQVKLKISPEEQAS